MKQLLFHAHLVPDRIDNGDVAFHCGGENSVGGRHLNGPEHDPREPGAADDLVPDAGARHSSSVDLDDGRQQRQHGRTRVRDALVHDQNVDRLNTPTETVQIILYLSK